MHAHGCFVQLRHVEPQVPSVNVSISLVIAPSTHSYILGADDPPDEFEEKDKRRACGTDGDDDDELLLLLSLIPLLLHRGGVLLSYLFIFLLIAFIFLPFR